MGRQLQHTPSSPDRARREPALRHQPLCCVHPLRSHRAAVLDATLGRNARPWQKAAEKALGLSVYPLGDGTRAQAGQRGSDVLQVVSGHLLRTATVIL